MVDSDPFYGQYLVFFLNFLLFFSNWHFYVTYALYKYMIMQTVLMVLMKILAVVLWFYYLSSPFVFVRAFVLAAIMCYSNIITASFLV